MKNSDSEQIARVYNRKGKASSKGSLGSAGDGRWLKPKPPKQRHKRKPSTKGFG